jgi:phage terminase large subunit-like protein
MQLVDGSKLYGTKGLTKAQIEVRDLALNSFEHFIRLIAPFQLLAHCHIGLCKWIQDQYLENKLILWPRDHGKSRLAAFYAAWEVCRDPAITIIYASATAEKAQEQLRFIKTLLDSNIAKRYFPGLFEVEEGRREAWNNTYIIVDHPRRKEEGVVDSTIMTCGLEKVITGKHCNRLILDDIVVPENNTETGRRDVNAWVAQAASIISSDSCIFDVGTRYHPKDAHQIAMDMVATHTEPDKDGNEQTIDIPMFQVNMANVETSGEFLWPRTQRSDGKWFGFDERILARKRAVYEAAGEITQFYAQYYNDPNDKSSAPIAHDLFKYYDRSTLKFNYGLWELDGRALYTYCAVDLAASLTNTSDYTVCVVGAIDQLGNRYVLDIIRYRTDKTSKTLQEVRNLYAKWKFKKLRIEAVGGFKLVAQDLADNLQDAGIRIPMDLYVPPNMDGKVARVNGILEPLYQCGAVYHYRGEMHKSSKKN